MIVVVLLVMVVDVLLLLATAKLLGEEKDSIRIFVAVGVDAIFVAVSSFLFPDILNGFFCRFLILVLIGFVAFGFSWAVLVFTLLNMSLGGIADSQSEILPILLGTAGLGFACLILGKERKYVSVELPCGAETMVITALKDTGNALRDPITGKPVLIVGAETAHKLTGLTSNALLDPVGNIDAVPGLRLIPYKTVGNAGFLLAVQIPKAKIGSRKGSVLVALSPQNFGSHYQALTGGTI